jgi:hypothetical protein
MPTLTIETSQFVERNRFVDEFMVRVGASVERSEFYAALCACLENMAVATDEDVAMMCHADQSVPSKKRKRMSEESEVTSRQQQQQQQEPVVTLAAGLTLPMPLICRPLPADSPGYTILPQHVTLYIFAFCEKSLNDFDNIAGCLCRFRSQQNERQFHLQWRSLIVQNILGLE